MTQSAPASRPDIDEPPPPLTAQELATERLEAEGWPVLRGTAAQRDARFVKKLLKAQLTLLRGRR
ncbi:MAG TPA: hypothetical protein VN805_02485 [Caulobacteraceae bacterium]|nr:hypothetical protein [Caulobacteraceae bacterium]